MRAPIPVKSKAGGVCKDCGWSSYCIAESAADSENCRAAVLQYGKISSQLKIFYEILCKIFRFSQSYK